MAFRVFRGLALLSIAAALSVSAFAQSPPSLRLYVFDCGTMLDTIPVVAYLIVHPRGTLMWEAGAVPDATLGPQASERRPAPLETFKVIARTPLQARLAEAGFTPDRITFFATSHAH